MTLALVALVASACSDAGSADGATSTSAPGTTMSGSSTSGSSTPGDDATTDAEAAPSSGCGVEPDIGPLVDDPPGDIEATFDSGGVGRIYRLGRSADYDPDTPVPLVVNLHGSGSDALQASLYGDVPRAAVERGMVTVSAQAIAGQWELGGAGADADFLESLVDDVESRYCIDLNRVHLVGMSLGAWKAAVTACSEVPRYASAALVTVEVHGGCALPVIAFHGTDDPVVAYGEGGTVDDANTPNAGLPGTLDNMDAWANAGGCEAQPDLEALGEDVEHRVWPGCDDGVSVELYTILGGGHTWPGSEIIIGPEEWTTDTIDATELLLDFFEDHPRTP